MKFTQSIEETMTKVCISGYYGFKNFGDETILSVLVNHLKNCDVTVFSSNPDYTMQTYNVKAVRSFDMKNVVKTIQNSDVLISGGGSLLQDVTSFKSLVYYALIIGLGIIFDKKVIIFAQGIGPINNNFAQIIVKTLLKQCAYVSVRDNNSFEILKKWGIAGEIVCDPVYSLEIQPTQNSGAIGIQLRDFKSMNYNLLQKLAMLVSTKFADKKIEIFSLQESLDLELCKKFKNIIHSINPDVKTEIVTDDIITRISKLDYFIAMRFHAILVALKCGVKTCAINYDIKVEQLAKSANIPLISMDANENMEVIFKKLQNLNSKTLSDVANSKHFDWTHIDKLLF